MDSVLILDFGGQTTQLIERRLRDFGVYSKIVPGDASLQEYLDHGKGQEVKGIILSGSPYTASHQDSPSPDPQIFTSGLPLLGICYGLHQMMLEMGGKVQTLLKKEYGHCSIKHNQKDPLFHNIPADFRAWMSHGDSVTFPGEDFIEIASSENSIPAALAHRTRPFWGLQYHPEASHCDYGSLLLENFACGICAVEKKWSLEQYIEQECVALRKEVGQRDVLLLISGGVDSTVVAALLLKALKQKQIWLMYVDTGMMRQGESQEIEKKLASLGAENILSIDARQEFLSALKDVHDPEKKRQIIGDVFIRVQEKNLPSALSSDYFLAQGTLYTDLIESGQGVGNKAQMIKSHHNVGTPLVIAKRAAGEILEPLKKLYKDEVRRLGELLGLNSALVYRHPFPGPGLAIRILSDIDEEKLRILREADALYIKELRARGLYEKIWQAFAVLLPLRTVGLVGDTRSYSYVLALRAVISKDGMSAEVFDFPTKDLLEISAILTNSLKQVGRVVYDISSKPPATIEWE